MGLLALNGLLLQTAGTAPSPAPAPQAAEGGHHVLSLLWHADPVVQFSMAILLFFSVVSWAIIFMKYKQLKNVRRDMSEFLNLFWKAKSVESLVTKTTFRPGPLVSILKTGVAQAQEGGRRPAEAIERDIARQAENEIEELESYLPFLATTASVAPFIGLFGTVWGILQAFWNIGRAGSTSLAVVGPYIAEALIATAIGLAAAIPAVIFYNFFINKLRIMSREIGQFAHDLAGRLSSGS